jgi:hypothetical protein
MQSVTDCITTGVTRYAYSAGSDHCTTPMTALGQMQTHAPQQGDLFDHLVGAGEKGVRNLKAKRLGRLEIEIRSTARRL